MIVISKYLHYSMQMLKRRGSVVIRSNELLAVFPMHGMFSFN